MFTRTEALLGKENIKKLSEAHIVLCGVGGVGSYTFEALVRTGVEKITVVDGDRVEVSNINRQLIATYDTVGEIKVEVAKKRAKSINPSAEIIGIEKYLTADNIKESIPKDADYIIDAIDFIPAKVGLALFAKENGLPIISCLGTGKRLDGNRFEFCDIFETKGCPLARKMRYELKKAGVDSLTVLFSKAETLKTEGIGSVAFVPSVAGLLIAQKVICDIIGEK